MSLFSGVSYNVFIFSLTALSAYSYCSVSPSPKKGHGKGAKKFFF